MTCLSNFYTCAFCSVQQVYSHICFCVFSLPVFGGIQLKCVCFSFCLFCYYRVVVAAAGCFLEVFVLFQLQPYASNYMARKILIRYVLTNVKLHGHLLVCSIYSSNVIIVFLLSLFGFHNYNVFIQPLNWFRILFPSLASWLLQWSAFRHCCGKVMLLYI